MEKRVLLAVVLCLAALLIWARLFPSPQPPSPPAARAPIEAAAAPALAPQPGGPVPEQEQVVEVPGLYRAVVTSRGAALKSFQLLDKKYYTTHGHHLVLPPGATQPVSEPYDDKPMDLITTYKPSLAVSFPDSGFTLPPAQAQSWSLVSNDPAAHHGRKLVYRWADGDVELRKTLLFSGDSYQVAAEVEVKNLRSAPVSHHLDVELQGYQDPAQKPGGMFSARVPQNEAAWDCSGKMQSANLSALLEKVPADKLRCDLRWIGIEQQYFLLGLAMPHGEAIPGGGEKQGHASAQGDGELSISAEYAERTLGPGQSVTYPMTLYAGPKLPELLDDVTVAGQPSDLKTSINYTLAVIARPLLWILRQVHRVVGSWALAIVILTVLVKLATLYPSHRSMRSMKAMAELKPELDALKEKCGEDKNRFNMEMMALYKKHDVNPLGGCLPMLLQMPIWFALYSMLGNAVELYRVHFLWIKDLTAPDPYYILPLLTGGLMFLQARLSPPPADPQQKMMTNFMPILFTGFSLFIPAGLTLYIMTSTVLGMIQQAVINKGQVDQKNQKKTAAR